MKRRYLVTQVKTWVVEAENRDDARELVLELSGDGADTCDIQVEYVPEPKNAA